MGHWSDNISRADADEIASALGLELEYDAEDGIDALKAHAAAMAVELRRQREDHQGLSADVKELWDRVDAVNDGLRSLDVKVGRAPEDPSAACDPCDTSAPIEHRLTVLAWDVRALRDSLNGLDRASADKDMVRAAIHAITDVECDYPHDERLHRITGILFGLIKERR